MKKLIASLLLCISTHAFAYDHCCNPCDIFSGVEVYGSALYWRPTYDGSLYATQRLTDSDVAHFVQPDWNWGYRVGASLDLCCGTYFLESNYTYFTQHHEARVSGNEDLIPAFLGFFFTTSFVDGATARLDSKYAAVDITGGYNWLCGTHWDSYLFAGARYFHIKERESYVYIDDAVTPSTIPVVQRYGITGWGPRLGVRTSLTPFSRMPILCNLGIQAQVAATAGIASQELMLKTTEGTSLFPNGGVVYPNRLTTVLGTDMQLEFFYEVDVLCLNIRAAGGYELNYYANGRERVESSIIDNTINSTSGLGYGGPYVNLSLSY